MLTDNIVLKQNGLYESWFTAEQPNYWPITWTSYWLEHKLWELNPTGYHITNILIHAASSVIALVTAAGYRFAARFGRQATNIT